MACQAGRSPHRFRGFGVGRSSIDFQIQRMSLYLSCFARLRYIHQLRPDGWAIADAFAFEESPGSMETGRRVMPARRKPRESATESRPPQASLG